MCYTIVQIRAIFEKGYAMPIRGKRSIWPSSGKADTGIFSTKGRQKKDSVAAFSNMSTMRYAHGTSDRSKPSGNGNQGLRHQKPNNITQLGKL